MQNILDKFDSFFRWHRIKMKLKDIFYYPIVCFPENITKLFKWIPIIWKDKDFDHSYMFLVLKKKLNTMYEFFNSDYSCCEEAKERAVQIKEAIECIDYILDEKWFDDAEQYKGIDNNKWFNEIERLKKENDDKLFNNLKENYADWWD